MGKLKFMNIRRVVGFFILCAVIFSCVAVSSCGDKYGGNTAMTLTYGKNTTKFSSNIYSYYLSYQKTTALYNIYTMYKSMGADVPDNPAAIDSPAIWTNPYTVNGMPEIATFGDYVKLQAEESMKRLLATVAYCKENKLELSKEEKQNIDAVMEKILSGSFNKSKTELNTVLFRFNINYDILKEIKRYESLADVMGKFIFDADTGKRKITDDMIASYYQQVCVRVKHIMIPYPAQTLDVNGDPEPYPEEEVAAMQAKIDDAYGRAAGGEDFDNLFADYDDPMGAVGYTLGLQTTFMPKEVMTAAFEMKNGEVRKIESAYGAHIIKKYALLPVNEAMDIEESQSRDEFVPWDKAVKRMLQIAITNEELQPYVDKVEINTAETDLFDILSSSLMFDCFEITRLKLE